MRMRFTIIGVLIFVVGLGALPSVHTQTLGQNTSISGNQTVTVSGNRSLNVGARQNIMVGTGQTIAVGVNRMASQKEFYA